MSGPPEVRPHVRLRPTTVADLEYVLAAEHAPENRVFVIPWTREQHGAALSDPDLMHRIVEDADGRTVGFLLFAGLASPHRSIELRRIVVTEKGRGHGRAALRAVQEFAFAELGAHRLWLDVKEHNTRARALYEEEGFVMEGCLRECLVAPDGFESLYIMSMLEHERSIRRSS
jgi:diamine N-acetyltransferase